MLGIGQGLGGGGRYAVDRVGLRGGGGGGG